MVKFNWLKKIVKYYCIELKSVIYHISNSEYTFLCIIQEYTEFHIFRGLYFPHFTIFCNNFTKVMMLFAAFLMNIPSSNVCPQGDRIVHCATESESSTVIMHFNL